MKQSLPIISIPKPCHEDWNRMTPDQRGAFCKVCNKSVIDFSSKNETEVLAILQQNTGTGMCGRFRSDQVLEPLQVDIPFWLLPERMTPLRAFMVALLIVFGTSLLYNASAQRHTMGKMVFRPDTVKKEVPKCDSSFRKGEVMSTHITGDILLLNKPVIDSAASVNAEDTDKAAAELAEAEVIADSIAGAIAEAEPKTGYQDNLLDSVIMTSPVLNPDSFEVVTVVMGGFRMIDLAEQSEDVPDSSFQDSVAPDSTTLNREAINPVTPPEAFRLTVLNNPTMGKLNLKLMMNVNEDFKLDLYDLMGRKLRSFMPLQRLDEGAYNLEFNISALPSGSYLCVAVSKDYKQEARIMLTK